MAISKRRLNSLVNEFALLEKQAELVQTIFDRMDEIKSELREELDTGTYDSKFGFVKVTPYSRFDEEVFSEMLSPKKLNSVTTMVPKLDRALAQEKFPNKFEKSKVRHDNRVSVKPNEESINVESLNKLAAKRNSELLASVISVA